MRIALIGNDLYPQFPLRGYGGIESSVETLAFGLHRAGHDFFCVVPSLDGAKAPPNGLPDYPFEIIRTRARATVLSRDSPAGFIGEVVDILRAAKPDAIWAQSCWSAGPLAALGIPTIVTVQDSGPGDPDRLLRHPSLVYRFISAYQYRLWVRDEDTRRRALMAHTSLGDEEYDFNPAGGDAFLWVGGLGWGLRGKGLDTFIELARRNPGIRFVAYASGRRLAVLRARWSSLGLRNFRFMGELVRGQAHREAFKNARALVMPTRLMEALGRTVLESLSKGTPVLGSTNGALPELIDDSCGVTTNDFEEMNAALHATFDRGACFAGSRRFHVRHEVAKLMEVTGEMARGAFPGGPPLEAPGEAARP
ncbi:MAG: glycosyltransferase family 4 protein [Vicinamibacteria bacterium]|nr:glycosyltransferase family 4 protein [Vicinamibacteria bacterium]